MRNFVKKSEKIPGDIYHTKVYFHELFQMPRSNSELWGKKLLIIDFFQLLLFKWEIEGSSADSNRPILATLTMRILCF